jgi:phosphatidate phosphatase APP1
LEFEAVMPAGDERRFRGDVLLIPPTGVSVISDIDDTIKITGVGDRNKLIENTLFKPFEAVPGMAEVYRKWADDGLAFHYVTASPWQLYEPLCGMCGPKGFPSGTWDMKYFRWKDSTALDLLKSPEKYKPEIIERILADFPRRRFVFVGDSGERDPEIYGAIARKHPRQVERILIRSVTEDKPDGERYHAAFANVPAGRWQVFEKAEQIKPVVK